ncbi:MAG: cytochrome c biogenesis protein ResB [Prevotella sp.]|jgi:hypothetical protein|nr:cytochrome c biogenesis protein ResB [Prevotella sp.]
MTDKKKMWEFPWRYKESIAIITGIIIIGFILQLLIGKFNFLLFSSPVNLIVGGIIILFLILFSFARKNAIYHWFSGVPFAVSLIGGLLILGIVMGLTPQLLRVDPHDSSALTRLGFRQITSSWAFVLVYFLTLLSLGALIVRRLIAFKIKDYAFYFNHIGLWIILFAAGLGTADIKRYVMYVYEGEVEWRVYNDNGDVLELPVAIQLNDFVMEEYPPKLAIIDRNTGETLPISKPDYFQIDEKRPSGKLYEWNISIEEYIHEAIRNSDSTYYHMPMPGSSPAARVRAERNGNISEGWVCGGSMSQLYMTLPLDSQHCVVMTQSEPKRFMSDITVITEHEDDVNAQVEVNKPLKIGDWMIYQYGYNTQAGKASTYSSFELVYDPWLWPVYIGIILFALGSVCLLWSGNKKTKKEDDVE